MEHTINVIYSSTAYIRECPIVFMTPLFSQYFSIGVACGCFLVALRSAMGDDCARCNDPTGNIVDWMPLIGLVLFYTFHSLGMSQISYHLPSELIPSKNKSIGTGVLNFMHGISLYVAVQLHPFIDIYLGLNYLFITFTIASLGSAFFVWQVVPETKGQSLVDIE